MPIQLWWVGLVWTPGASKAPLCLPSSAEQGTGNITNRTNITNNGPRYRWGMPVLGKTVEVHLGANWHRLFQKGKIPAACHRRHPCSPLVTKTLLPHKLCARGPDKIQLTHAWSLCTTDTTLAVRARILPASPGPFCCLLSKPLLLWI